MSRHKRFAPADLFVQVDVALVAAIDDFHVNPLMSRCRSIRSHDDQRVRICKVPDALCSRGKVSTLRQIQLTIGRDSLGSGFRSASSSNLMACAMGAKKAAMASPYHVRRTMAATRSMPSVIVLEMVNPSAVDYGLRLTNALKVVFAIDRSPLGARTRAGNVAG